MHSQLMSPIKNQNGYVMIMTFVLMALVSIVASSILDLQLVGARSVRTFQIHSTADRIQKSAMSAIYNDEAWAQQTAGNNTCLKSGINCPQQAAGGSSKNKLILKDANGKVISNMSDNRQGYTFSGESCSAFNGNTGNPACPFRYEVSWEPTKCSGGVCQIKLTGTLRFNPGANMRNLQMNLQKYSFSMIRGQVEGSLQEACNANMGTFNQITNKCEVAFGSDQSCPPGQYLTRVSNAGGYSCQAVIGNAGVCPRGTAAVGYLANGAMDCRSSLDWN